MAQMSSFLLQNQCSDFVTTPTDLDGTEEMSASVLFTTVWGRVKKTRLFFNVQKGTGHVSMPAIDFSEF